MHLSLSEWLRPRLRNVKISTKLSVSFLSLGLLMAIIGGIGFWGINQVHESTNYTNNIQIPKLNSANLGRVALTQVGRLYRQAVLDMGTDTLATDLSGVKTQYQAFQDNMNAYYALPHNAREVAVIADMKTALQQYQPFLDDLIATITLNTPAARDQAIAKITKGSPAIAAISTALDNIQAANNAQSMSVRNDANTLFARMEWALVILVVCLLLISLGISRVITNIIIEPLNHMVAATEEVARGNLQEMDQLVERFGGADATGRLTLSLAQMVGNFRSVVSRISDLSTQINATSQHIAEASFQSQSATEQVANSIQNVTQGALMQTQKIGQSAVDIHSLATRSEMLQGESQQSMAAMQSLERSVDVTATKIRALSTQSEEIGKIVQTINEIAEQTNLLALNAAIEAARAGDLGRGFAIVADEVRKLAERSATATKEISALIQETQSETNLALQAMEQGLQQVNESVERVTASTKQAQSMASNAAEVKGSIDAVAKISQETGSTAEDVSAAAEELSAQFVEMTQATKTLSDIAHSLKETVDVFHVDGAVSHGSPRTLPTREEAWSGQIAA